MNRRQHQPVSKYLTPEKAIHPDPRGNKHLEMKTPPTVDPKTIYTDKGGKVSFAVEHTVSKKKNTPYIDRPSNEASALLADYEARVRSLELYLRETEHVEKEHICDIFGWGITSSERVNEERIILRELSTKVKDLIQENKKLRVESRSELEHGLEYLVKENKKLQMIIEEFKASENQMENRLRSENAQLKGEIIRLNQKIQELQVIRKTTVVSQPVVVAQTPPTIPNMHVSSHQNDVERKLIDQVNRQTERLNQANISNLNRIAMLEGKIVNAEKRLAHYENERKLSIESTIRKSLALSISMKRPVGQHEQQPQPEPQEPGKVTSGFRNAQVIMNQPSGNDRELQSRLALSEDKNRFLTSEIARLKEQLDNAERRGAESVEKLITMDKEMRLSKSANVVEKQRVESGSFQEEVKNIRETLTFCNTANFELFFQELNEIIRQRNEMRQHLEETKRLAGKESEETIRKNKEGRKLLEEKVVTLTAENTRLMKRVKELEEDIENYQAELLTSEIEKLNSVDLNSPLAPTGEEAIKWQHTVRQCINSAVQKLEVLEGKMVQKKKFLKVTR